MTRGSSNIHLFSRKSHPLFAHFVPLASRYPLENIMRLEFSLETVGEKYVFTKPYCVDLCSVTWK